MQRTLTYARSFQSDGSRRLTDSGEVVTKIFCEGALTCWRDDDAHDFRWYLRCTQIGVAMTVQLEARRLDSFAVVGEETRLGLQGKRRHVKSMPCLKATRAWYL